MSPPAALFTPGRLALITVTAMLVAACAPPETGDGDLEARVAEQEARILEQEQVIAELEQQLVEAEEGVPAPEATPEPDPRPEPATVRTEDALTEQLRTLGDWGMPDADAGTTGWHDDAFEIPEGFREQDVPEFRTPGELLVALTDAWEFSTGLGGEAWEVTLRVLAEGPEGVGLTEADTATAALLLWGFLDDSVAGEDRLLHLRQGDSGWYVESGEARFHCPRGVAGDLCL